MTEFEAKPASTDGRDAPDIWWALDASLLPKEGRRNAEERAAKLSKVLFAAGDIFSDINREEWSIRFCLDFDIIYSAYFDTSKNSKTEEEFGWAAFLLSMDEKFIVLPGALYELMHHFQAYKSNVYQYDNSITSRFLDSFESDDRITPEKMHEFYEGAFEIFSKALLGVEVEGLRALITQKLDTIDIGTLPDVYREYFYSALGYLSKQTREEKITNNRVDAYNISCIKYLNDYSERTKYIFVTDTKCIHDFIENYDDIFKFGSNSRYRSRNICNSMLSSVLFSINRVGITPQRASTIAWGAATQISNAIAALKRGGRSVDELSLAQSIGGLDSEGYFKIINLLGGVFDYAMNERLRRSVQKPGTMQKRLAYLRDISVSLDKLRSKYGELVPQHQRRRTESSIKIEHRLIQGSPYENYAIRNAITNIEVAGMYISSAYFGVYFGTKSSILQIINTINLVHSTISRSITTGGLRHMNRNIESRRTGIHIISDGKSYDLLYKSVSWPLSVDIIANITGRAPSDVTFLRLDTPWFGVSYEKGSATMGGNCAIASHLEIFDEVGVFMSELNERIPDYKHCITAVRKSVREGVGVLNAK